VIHDGTPGRDSGECVAAAAGGGWCRCVCESDSGRIQAEIGSRAAGSAVCGRIQEQIEENCEGHFLLPSGKHTNVFIQVSLGLRFVGTSKAVGFTLYKQLREAGLLDQIDAIIGPPVGALPVVAALQYAIDSSKIEAMYLDRAAGGKFRLGRASSSRGAAHPAGGRRLYDRGSLRKAIAACNESVRESGEECYFVGPPSC